MTRQAHPYADAWPMFSEDDLAELTDDIATNGLLDPIVVDADGLILDGRNRLAACEAAGVKPEFTEYDGNDALGFVLSRNGQRRHQSKGSRAASWALAMLEAGERSNGRWTYGKSQDVDLHKQWRAMLGTIADHAPDLLYEVRDDDMTLNAAHDAACASRDAEADRIRRAQEEAEAEEEAREFIEREAPDLAGRVDGTDLLTYAEALDLWKRRNHEEAERIAREKAEKEKREREEKQARSDLYTGIARNIEVFAAYGRYPDADSVMGEYDPTELKSPRDAASFEPPALADAKRFIDGLIEWIKK